LWTASELRFGERENALLFTVFGLSLAGLQLGVTRVLARRVRNERLLWSGILLLGLGSASVLAVSSWWHLGLPTLLLSAGNALCSPAALALLSLSAPDGHQGETLGVVQSVGALGRITGPAACGAIFEHVGHKHPYLASALVLLATLGLASRDPHARVEEGQQGVPRAGG
jgi:MFS family permease